MFSLMGKNVILTGGMGILGKIFVEAFLDQGANIAIVDRDQNEINSYVSFLSTKYQAKIMGYECDISLEHQVEKLIKDITDDFQKIHILHNNAATKSSDLNNFFAPFEEYPLKTWKEIMAVNIDGMFLMAKHVGRHMVEKKIGGSIIQTASIYGVCAPDQRIYEGSEYLGQKINTPAVYSVSKAAVIGLTQYLSAYWGDKGIRVNTLTPGGIESGQNSTFVEKYSNRVPMHRMGKPRELVGALIYLASDASSYVTGQNIIIDGGLSVW